MKKFFEFVKSLFIDLTDYICVFVFILTVMLTLLIILSLSPIILVVYVIISSSKEKMSEEEEYVDMYKEKFILPLLREIFPDVLYRPKDSLPLDKYLEAL